MRNVALDLLWGGLVALLFMVDRMLKTALVTGVDIGIMDYIPITLGTRLNEHGALGVPLKNSVVVFVSSLLIIVVLLSFFKSIESGKLFRARALFAVTAGAGSNIIDRVFIGGVVDYLALHPALPVFNIADALIAGGLVLWFVSSAKDTMT